MRLVRVARAATAGGVVVVAVLGAAPVAASAAATPSRTSIAAVPTPVEFATPATGSSHRATALSAVGVKRPTTRPAVLATLAASFSLVVVSLRLARRRVAVALSPASVDAASARGPPGVG